MKNNPFKNLSVESERMLCYGLLLLMVAVAVRIVFSSDLALKVSDNQLILSDTADKLSTLAEELDSQADVIRQKDAAYEELQQVYQRSLKEAEGYERLKTRIETIDSLPDVENLETIQSEIEITEESISEFIDK